jgi:hypothetical protein
MTPDAGVDCEREPVLLASVQWEQRGHKCDWLVGIGCDP